MAGVAADGPGVSYSNPSSFGAGIGQRGQSLMGESLMGGGGGGGAAMGMAASDRSMLMGPGGGMGGMGMAGGAGVGTAPGGMGGGMGGGVMSAGGGLVLGAEHMGVTIASALPPHLLQLEKFILLTDEGPVAVRARYNGTIGYLKRQVRHIHTTPPLS